MLANDLGADPKPAIEASIFIGLKRQKGFAPPVTSLGIEEADRDKMHEKAKRDLPDAVAMPAQRCAGLAGMSAGIRRKIILPEISCFRKVAQ
jgi:hypothetical protein